MKPHEIIKFANDCGSAHHTKCTGLLTFQLQSKRTSNEVILPHFFGLFLTHRKIRGKNVDVLYGFSKNMKYERPSCCRWNHLFHLFVMQRINNKIVQIRKWKMENHRHRSCAPLCANSGQATTLGISTHTHSDYLSMNIVTYVYMCVSWDTLNAHGFAANAKLMNFSSAPLT